MLYILGCIAILIVFVLVAACQHKHPETMINGFMDMETAKEIPSRNF